MLNKLKTKNKFELIEILFKLSKELFLIKIFHYKKNQKYFNLIKKIRKYISIIKLYLKKHYGQKI